MIDGNAKNPAFWLLLLWDRMPRDDKSLQQSALAGWATTFGYKTNDFRVLEALTSVYANVDESVRLTKRLKTTDRKKEQLVSWRPAFDGALNAVSNGNRWQHVLQHFTADRRVHLEYCATELDLALGEGSTLNDIREAASKIEHLIVDLQADASIDEEFKVLVRDLLEALRRALVEYEVRGQKGVYDSLGVIVGNLSRYTNAFNTPEKKTWGKKLREAISLAADVATVSGVTVLTMSSSVAGFLPPP